MTNESHDEATASTTTPVISIYFDCCPDNWSVWLRFETWIWAVLLLVQVSMIVFLVVHGRKDKSYRQAFFVFFVAVTVVDCVLVLWRPSSLEWDLTIFGKFYDDPWMYWEDPKTNETNSSHSPTYAINGITLNIVVPVFSHAQPLFLTAAAVNRFTAICFPLKHASVWSARRVAVVVIALTLVATLFGAGFPVVTLIRQVVICSAATRKQSKTLGCESVWAFYDEIQWFVCRALVIIISTICCVVCFTLNIGSITMMIVLRATGKLRQKAPELRLFVHSLYMFLLQIFLTFQDLIYVEDNLKFTFDNLGIEGLSWIDLPHSTEWLLGVKGTVLRFNGRMYYLPACRANDVHYLQNSLPMCSAWYRFLVGELRLREDPEFTVRAMAQCMLALSGSIFLLLISGNVRNAYFKFYFKCLQRKGKQHGSVNTVQVAAAGTS